jgi:hypothetical protein
VTDVLGVADLAGDSVAVNVTVGAGVSISPTGISMSPGSSQTFSAWGGSGTGYVWSLDTNASRGTIDTATGSYTAGSTGGVSDVVMAIDSLGNVARVEVLVTKPPSGGGCSQGAADGLSLLSLALVGLLSRKRGLKPDGTPDLTPVAGPAIE